MRIAVVYHAEKNLPLIRDLAKGVARGLESQGASVDVINSKEFTSRLTIYNYIVLGTEVTGNFGGSIPPSLSKFLEAAGPVGSKRSCGFLPARGFRRQKSLLKLMTTMEKEGMFVTDFDILPSADAAEALGKKLNFQSRH
ncbi:MAG: hypothetical protein JEY99_00495 [Spirochaetales bacterium]|nr:hypothetical protein [Spirochaetales bacterium]